MGDAYTAPASRVLTVLHIQAGDGCLTDCDPDCEAGPRHCEWVHLPSHKPGWHSLADCPRDGHEAAAGFTVCGLPMLYVEMWRPLEKIEGFPVCRGCEGLSDEQGAMW